MRVILVGATGKVGKPLLLELRERGHEVIAVARNADRASEIDPAVEVRQGDVFDMGFVRGLLKDGDVLITSVRMKDEAQHDRTVLGLHRSLIELVGESGTRWIAMGGAGSLEVAPGVTVLEAGKFPVHRAKFSGISAEKLLEEGYSNAETVKELRKHPADSLRWTYISPAIEIVVGAPRTGTYRRSENELLTDADGNSRISDADLAVAVVDEMETSAFVGKRLHVAY